MPTACPDRRHALAALAGAALGGGVAIAQDPAFPPELTRFRQLGDSPVFGPGAPGDWDAAIRERGWILQDNSGWRLWYTGYATKNGRRMLGLATSTDGIRWHRHPANPLIKDHWVEDVMVVRDVDRLLMVAEGEADRTQLLESADGISWKRHGTLDVRLTNGMPIPEGPFGTPVVWKDDKRWCLFYERMDKGVWLATSTDLKVWKNLSDTPVLRPGPASHDLDMVAMNQIFRHKGRYYASYHGTNTQGQPPRQWCSCLAVSDDLIRWTKLETPLFPPKENKSSGVFVPHGKGYRLYTMHPAVTLHEPSA